MILTKDDFRRYSRQIMLPEVGVSGQEKIKKAKVLVVGAGGLGCPVLQYIVAAGIGTVGIVDFDSVAIHNIHRQVLHKEQNIGLLKTESAERTLKELNTQANVIIHHEKLVVDNAEQLMAGYDIIIDGSDNFATRYLVNDTCVLLGKPLVYGSIFKFEGQVTVFNHQGSAHLRDIFPEPPPPEMVPNCAENGVLGTLPAIIGTMMAHEALKLVVGLPVLTNQLVVFNTLDMSYNKLIYSSMST